MQLLIPRLKLIKFGRKLGSKDKKKRNLKAKTITYQEVKYKLGASKISTNKNKKRVREITNLSTGVTKKVHYGYKPMDNYSNGHRSEKRRNNYLSRSAGIRDGQGNLTKGNPMSPNFLSREDLW